MKGLHLRSLSGELLRVEPKCAEKPMDAITGAEEKLWPSRDAVARCFDHFSFAEHFYRLPLKVFRNFSFDELCKIYYSTIFMMDESVRRRFETNPRYEVVRKIKSSMWRWGSGSGVWNEVVDAYDNIRRFSFISDPDFEIRLDYSTYWNEFGYSKYSRTYLDGVFAFLVYFKREHVMTIGFSIMEKKRLLIQQIQSTRRTGNRYLYRLPPNRLEFVIDLFRKNFPGYALYVIDGGSLAEKTLADYRRICSNLYRDESRRKELQAAISHLEADKPRLAAFYRDSGRFRLGPHTKKVNGLEHLQVCSSRTKRERTSIQPSLGTPP